MKQSLQGHLLPETAVEYNVLESQGRLLYRKCQNCDGPHKDRTHTKQGWLETQISGWCEDCFDGLFKVQQKEDDNALD